MSIELDSHPLSQIYQLGKTLSSFLSFSVCLLLLCDLGWLSGEQAEYIELLSDEEVGRRCVENLKEFLGPNKTLPNLKKVVRFETLLK